MNRLYYIGLGVQKKIIAYCIKTIDGRLVEAGKIAATRKSLDERMWERYLVTQQSVAGGTRCIEAGVGAVMIVLSASPAACSFDCSGQGHEDDGLDHPLDTYRPRTGHNPESVLAEWYRDERHRTAVDHASFTLPR